MSDPELSLAATKKLLEDTSLHQCLNQLPALHFQTEAPPKPRDTVKLTTMTTLGEALKASLFETLSSQMKMPLPPSIPIAFFIPSLPFNVYKTTVFSYST